MTLQTLLRPIAIAAAAGLVVACGSSTATGTPGAQSTEPPASAAAATANPIPTTPEFSITLPSEDKALEDLLPDEVAGATVSKSSVAGSDLVGTGDSDISKILGQLGKSPADISAAFGISSNVSLGAYRLKGVSATTLLDAFAQVLAADETPVVTDANLGGKAVKKVVSGGLTSYVYTKDDVLFTVSAVGEVNETAIADAISKLP